MKLLVAGGDRVDAGKTTFSTGLVARLGTVGFKPRAGNDFWFDHDDYRRAVADGRLYGKDAKRLAAASDDDVCPEDLNPVHRLWRPSSGPDSGLVGAARREFVLDRVADSFVVNAHADVPESARERLGLADAPAVATVDELDAETRRRHLPAFEALARRIERRADAVIESYGDVARPLRDLSVDAVAVVEPGRARVYDGERYGKACEVASRSARDGRMERRVRDVIEHLDPAARIDLPALPGDRRTDPDAVADAYAPAYEELLALAD
jgi:predicted P-loop ATPase/GTPase